MAQQLNAGLSFSGGFGAVVLRQQRWRAWNPPDVTYRIERRGTKGYCARMYAASP
jgi:hypothetical protein